MEKDTQISSDYLEEKSEGGITEIKADRLIIHKVRKWEEQWDSVDF